MATWLMNKNIGNITTIAEVRQTGLNVEFVFRKFRRSKKVMDRIFYKLTWQQKATLLDNISEFRKGNNQIPNRFFNYFEFEKMLESFQTIYNCSIDDQLASRETKTNFEWASVILPAITGLTGSGQGMILFSKSESTEQSWGYGVLIAINMTLLSYFSFKIVQKLCCS